MLVAFSSPVKVSKIVFPAWNCVHFEVVLQKQLPSVLQIIRKRSKFFTVNLIAKYEEIS